MDTTTGRCSHVYPVFLLIRSSSEAMREDYASPDPTMLISDILCKYISLDKLDVPPGAHPVAGDNDDAQNALYLLRSLDAAGDVPSRSDDIPDG